MLLTIWIFSHHVEFHVFSQRISLQRHQNKWGWKGVPQMTEKLNFESDKLKMVKFYLRFKCFNEWPPGTSGMTKNENFQSDPQTSWSYGQT